MRLYYLMATLLMTSCVIDIDISEDFEAQHALNGIIYSDTNAVFSFYRINRNETRGVVHANIWIEDDKGNTYECDYSDGIYVSRETHLPESDFYKVHAKESWGEEVTAITSMPPLPFEITGSQFKPVVDTFYRRFDTVTRFNIEYKRINEAYKDGYCRMGFSHGTISYRVWTPIILSPNFIVIENKSITYAQQEDFELTNSFFINELDKTKGQIIGVAHPDSNLRYLNLSIRSKDYLEHGIKANQQENLEYSYGEAAVLLPPIQTPDNVEGGFGFVTAIRNVRIKLER